MKWITRITLLICLTLPTLLSGCSTTRKTAKGTEQTNVTAIQETDRTEEEKRLAEVITNTETNDRTNVVIEFTKTEYADGEYGNEDRTTRTTSRRNRETETRNGRQRRHKVSYHRKDNHQRRPEGNDSDNGDGNRRKESRNTDKHRSKRGQDRDRRNGTGKET